MENLRDADRGEMNYAGVRRCWTASGRPNGWRWRRGFGAVSRAQRHAPGDADRRRHTRMLVVLAYNAQPDVMLSESARMTFYGRL